MDNELAKTLYNSLNGREDQELVFGYFKQSKGDLPTFVVRLKHAEFFGEITPVQLNELVKILNGIPSLKLSKNKAAFNVLNPAKPRKSQIA